MPDLKGGIFETNQQGLTSSDHLWHRGIEAMKHFQDEQSWGTISFKYVEGAVREVKVEKVIH